MRLLVVQAIEVEAERISDVDADALLEVVGSAATRQRLMVMHRHSLGVVERDSTVGVWADVRERVAGHEALLGEWRAALYRRDDPGLFGRTESEDTPCP